MCIHISSRLAEECASDPLLKENTFTAPSKHNHGQDSLDSLCRCLLHCCDSIWIPIVLVRSGAPHTHTHRQRHPHLILIMYHIISIDLCHEHCLASLIAMPTSKDKERVEVKSKENAASQLSQIKSEVLHQSQINLY